MSNFKNYQWRSQSVSKSISSNNTTPVKTLLFQNTRANSNSVKQQLFQNNIAQSSQRNSFKNYQNDQVNVFRDSIEYGGYRTRYSRNQNSDQANKRTNSAPKKSYQSFQNKDIVRQNLNPLSFKNSFQEYNFPVQNQSKKYQRPSIDRRNSQQSQPQIKVIKNHSYRQSFSSNNSISIQEYNKIREKTPEVRLIKASEKKVDLEKYQKKDEDDIRKKFNQIIKILNSKAKEQIKNQFSQMKTYQRQILYMEYINDKYKFFLEQRNFQNIQINKKQQHQIQNQDKEIQEKQIKKDEKENCIKMSSVYLEDQSPQNKKNIESQEESFQSVIEQQNSESLQSFHQSVQSEIVLENSNLKKYQTDMPDKKLIKNQNSILSDTKLINLNNKTSNIFLKKQQNNFNRVLSPKNQKIKNKDKIQLDLKQQSNFQSKYIEILKNQTVQLQKEKLKNDIDNKNNNDLQDYQIIIEDKFKNNISYDQDNNQNKIQDQNNGDIDQIHSDNTEEIPLFSEDRIIEEQYEEEEEDEKQAQKMNQKLQQIQQSSADHKRTFSFNEINICQPPNNNQIKNKILKNLQSNLFQKKESLEKQDIDQALQQTNENIQALLAEEKALEQEKRNLMLLKEQISKQKQEMQRIKYSNERLDFDKFYDPKFISNTSSQIRHLSESKRQNETLFSQPTTSRQRIQNQSISKTPKTNVNYSYESRILLTPNESVSKVRQTSNSNYRDSNLKNKFTESIIVEKKPWSERYMDLTGNKFTLQ